MLLKKKWCFKWKTFHNNSQNMSLVALLYHVWWETSKQTRCKKRHSNRSRCLIANSDTPWWCFFTDAARPLLSCPVGGTLTPGPRSQVAPLIAWLLFCSADTSHRCVWDASSPQGLWLLSQLFKQNLFNHFWFLEPWIRLPVFDVGRRVGSFAQWLTVEAQFCNTTERGRINNSRLTIDLTPWMINFPSVLL